MRRSTPLLKRRTACGLTASSTIPTGSTRSGSLCVCIARCEMAVYELVKARADGQLGPRLQPSTVDCVPKPGAKSPCTLDIRSGLFRGVGIGWGNGEPLALNIGVWDRPIVDKTGLSGAFDVDLQWTPDPAQARDTDAAARAAAAVAATPGDRVSIFTALQEQLGLRLQPARAQLEVLIIDRVERPTPD